MNTTTLHGFAIFGHMPNGTFCPFTFTDICPQGITRGAAHVYLRPDYPREKLREVLDNAPSPRTGKRRLSPSQLADLLPLSVRALELTRAQYLDLWDMDKAAKPLPECYRAVWVGGWETPAKSRERVTYRADFVPVS